MSSIAMSPAASAEFIASKAKFVTISQEGISTLSKEIISNMKSGTISIETYGDDGFHPTRDDPLVVDWTFVADTLNFCFWTPGDATKWRVDGQTGYYGLCAALKRAIKEGYDITNPNYFSTITLQDLTHIMRSDDGVTCVPLLPTRVDCLHEVGKILLEKFDGTFKNCILQANKSAVSLLNLVVEHFPCFRDEATFEGKRVSFYKRAQILVADLWSRFSGTDVGEFHDIEKLTMFADYRVPQALVHFKVMTYSPGLMDLLNKDQLLENGCPEEVEIRGCSIHAIELATAEVRRILQEDNGAIKPGDINSVLIDYFLWIYRRKYAAELEYIPFHKVYSKYY